MLEIGWFLFGVDVLGVSVNSGSEVCLVVGSGVGMVLVVGFVFVVVL